MPTTLKTNVYTFRVQYTKGFSVGLGLAVMITGWNVPGLHNLKDNGKELIVITHLEENDVLRVVTKRTKGKVKLELLKKE